MSVEFSLDLASLSVQDAQEHGHVRGMVFTVHRVTSALGAITDKVLSMDYSSRNSAVERDTYLSLNKTWPTAAMSIIGSILAFPHRNSVWDLMGHSRVRV